ncbi:hypothetical protein BV210_11135 [Halorientalis sp. IM1011]|nr:hypothetical protein BV210_11135 [Halorientalis sp. IM1011]
MSVSTVLSHLDDETSGHDANQLDIQLVHTHLPKLDRRGWIDYDAQRGSIRYHGHDSAHRHLSDLCAMFE